MSPLTAATFGWLCVETPLKNPHKGVINRSHLRVAVCWNSIPSQSPFLNSAQPPSGGCVLKHCKERTSKPWNHAATFGWLCVETSALTDLHTCYICSHLRVAVCWNILVNWPKNLYWQQPPSGGCVLKRLSILSLKKPIHAATFGWLCVET